MSDKDTIPGQGTVYGVPQGFMHPDGVIHHDRSTPIPDVGCESQQLQRMDAAIDHLWPRNKTPAEPDGLRAVKDRAREAKRLADLARELEGK